MNVSIKTNNGAIFVLNILSWNGKEDRTIGL